MRFWYPASITQITSINDSFDSCLLSICYAGKNRNKTSISKEAIEKAIPTMAYCPIVANYDVESDTIGGHDVDFVQNADGDMKMVNLTDAVGVIPDNPQWCWMSKVDDDGVEREYLSAPAILWKRTPVYDKLKRDGISGQSMEINVKDGAVKDGIFEINAFEFTAFCLLGDGIEPCFEGAQVAMFSADTLKARLSEMMADFKENYTKVMAASADDNITPSGENFSKGGEGSLNIEELLKEYELTEEDIDFDYSEMSEEEFVQRLEALKASKAETQEFADDSDDDEGDEPEEDDNDDAPGGTKQQGFQLTGEQMHEGILDALRTVSYKDEWGEWPRYCYVDYDMAVNEVYAYDNEDWNLYGFKYAMDGDNVVIDFDSKTRKKIAFVDFEGGSAQFAYEHIMDTMNARFGKLAEEINSLRAYKNGVEDAKRKAAEDEVFAKFEDLTDNEAFKTLRENCGEMSLQDIEDKCYAIRGRNVQVQFSKSGDNPVRLPVDRDERVADDEPYGGVFARYGFAKRS